jgi:Cu+-exporting ATPase
MAKADIVVFDKTGTITIGKPEVIIENVYEEFDRGMLYSLVKSSNHPVAKGILKYIKESNKDIQEIVFEEYMQIPAKGIKAKYQGVEYFGGNSKLLEDLNISVESKSQDTIFYFVLMGRIVAMYELRDKIKDGAQELVRTLQNSGMEVVLLSGDHKNITRRVAIEVGIKNYMFEHTPQEKAQYIEKLHKEGKKVVMVGDGVNDILALASAEVSIAMGGGSDIALDVGDVVLLDDTLTSLKEAFNISRKTLGLIKQNLFISLFYNALTIPLAMAGYIIPLFAAISMSLSSLLVVGNSLRIRNSLKR